MSTKFMDCLNNDCGSKPSGKKVEHFYAGIKPGAETPFGKMADELIVQCSHCGYQHLQSISKPRCHKRTWPYYNASTGVTFESESHEQAYVKKHNLTPA